jgi:single-strand DNA-binding protein
MLAGNLTRDPLLRKTATGVACADLSLAVNESYVGKDGKSQESTCFVDVVAWEKQAEACQNYLRKGAPVLVEGRLQFDQWEDKDGQKRNKLRVRADRVQFMGRAPGGEARTENGGRQAERADRGGREERSRRLPLED